MRHRVLVAGLLWFVFTSSSSIMSYCKQRKHDTISRKLSQAQEKVREMLKAEFMKWLFRFSILRFQLRYYSINSNSKRDISVFYADA